MNEIELKKRRYFTNLGLSVRDAIKLQMRFGLFEKDIETNKRKHQAPEHMLVVAARAQVLGEWLKLSPEMVKKLTLAAASHDVFKKHEINITRAANFTWESFEEASFLEARELQIAGVSQGLIDLARAGGHPLNEAQKKIVLQNPTETDWAWVIIFYIDNYTSGMSWVSGDPIVDRFENDQKKYPGFNESAVGKIDGHPDEKGFPALIRIGKEAQCRITRYLSELWGEEVNPSKLPKLIDEEIKRRIIFGEN